MRNNERIIQRIIDIGIHIMLGRTRRRVPIVEVAADRTIGIIALQPNFYGPSRVRFTCNRGRRHKTRTVHKVIFVSSCCIEY